MAQKQNEKDALLCTYGDCKELQTEDGEYCEKHFNRKEKDVFYGDHANMSDTKLVKEWQYYYDILADNLSKKNLENLKNLLDCERELTLREDR